MKFKRDTANCCFISLIMKDGTIQDATLESGKDVDDLIKYSGNIVDIEVEPFIDQNGEYVATGTRYFCRKVKKLLNLFNN